MSRSTFAAAALLISTAACATGLVTAATASAAAPEEARLAGCEFGTTAATYDWARFDEHAQRMLDITTGDFHAEYVGLRAELESKARESHIHADPDSVDCKSVSGDNNHAEVLVRVVRTVTSDTTAGLPKTSTISITLTMDKIDGRWLVGNAETRDGEPH